MDLTEWSTCQPPEKWRREAKQRTGQREILLRQKRPPKAKQMPLRKLQKRMPQSVQPLRAILALVLYGSLKAIRRAHRRRTSPS